MFGPGVIHVGELDGSERNLYGSADSFGEGEVTTMAMPHRDDKIEAIKRLDLLLEYAVQHGDEAEADRLRAALRRLTEEI